MEKHWGNQKTEVVRGKHGQEALLWFLWERTGEECKEVQDWVV